MAHNHIIRRHRIRISGSESQHINIGHIATERLLSGGHHSKWSGGQRWSLYSGVISDIGLKYGAGVHDSILLLDEDTLGDRGQTPHL